LPDFGVRKLPETTTETLPDVCVNTLCTGVFPAKKQGCTVCSLNTVSLSKKKKKQIRRGEAAAPEAGEAGGARRNKGRQRRWIRTQ